MNIPSEQEVIGRLQTLLGAGVGLDTMSAELLSGASEDTSLLAALEKARRGHRLSSNSWPLWERLNLGLIIQGRAAVLSTRNLATRTVAGHVLNMFAEALATIGRTGVLITTGQPTTKVWDDGPSDWLRLICPPRPAISPRVRAGDFRIALHDMAAPAEAAEIRLGSVIVGWAAGNKVWLRFHPFLGSAGRFSVADAPRRRALLAEVLRLGAEHLQVLSNEPSEEVVGAWQAALGDADWCLNFARAAESSLGNEHELLRRAESEAGRAVALLETQLADARERERAAGTAAAVIPSLLRARALLVEGALKGLDEQLGAVQSLPQVRSTKLRALNDRGQSQLIMEVLTQPLILDCGTDGLRKIASVPFGLPIQNSSDPRFPSGESSHPALSPEGTLDWTPVSVPLAQALGAGDLRAATALVCGLLARPLPALPSGPAGAFTSAPASARPGYISDDAV